MTTLDMSTLILSDVPFVGRHRELAELTQALRSAREGRGGVVLIAGEPGIGKTRLLSELAERARSLGHWVLSGRAYEAQSMQPYLPFVQVLEEYVRVYPSDRLYDELAAGALEVAGLVPELARHVKGLQEWVPPAAADPEYALLAGASNFLVSIAHAAPRGLLLCLDDLHWADRSSLLLLQHLARHLPRAPLLLVGTYQADGSDAASGLSDTLAELSREHLFRRLSLGSLSLDETRLLIEAINGAPASMAVAEAIFRRSGGNAFFVAEFVRHLRMERRNFADPETAITDWGVPEGAYHVLSKRLSRLRPETRAMLQIAAVFGTHFSTDALFRVSGLDLAAFMETIDEAVNGGIIREQGEVYGFTHSLLREKLYGELHAPRRQLLHLRVAEAIELDGDHDAYPQVAALAAHYRLAGRMADGQKAIGYFLTAAEMAGVVHAYDEAIGYSRAARDVADRDGWTKLVVEPEQRAALMERLGTLTVETGLDVPEGIKYQEQAVGLYTGLGLTMQAARAHSRLVQQLSGYPKLDLSRAFEHYKAAEALLRNEPEPTFLGNIYAGLAFAAYWPVRTQEGLAASQRAIEIAERQGNNSLWAAAVACRGWHLGVTGRLSSGRSLLDQAWQAADSADDRLAAFQAAFLRFGLAVEMVYDPGDVPPWCEVEASKPRLSQSLRMRRVLGQYRCIRRTLMGELAATPDEVRQGWSEPYHAFYAGDWEHAETLWARGRTGGRGDRWDEWRCTYWLSRVLRVQGRRAEAAKLLEEALGPAVETQAIVYELQFRSALALLFAETGRAVQAQPHLARCREILSGGEDWRGVAGCEAAAEGVVSGALGSVREAERQFSKAVELFRKCRLPWEEAEALHLWGRMYLEAGKRYRARARARFNSALDIYRRHEAGQRWMEHVLADQQRSLSFRSARPDGLSERELQVLRLIAAGRSNREIAETLTISTNTVFHHVSSIFNKTGVSNRTSAAAHAHKKALLDHDSGIV